MARADFYSISVPVIKQIAQDLILDTTNTSFNCSPFQALKDSGGVGGQFNCTVWYDLNHVRLVQFQGYRFRMYSASYIVRNVIIV